MDSDLTTFLMYTMVLVMFLMMMCIFLFLAYLGIGFLKAVVGIKKAVAPLAPLVNATTYTTQIAKPKDKLSRTEVQKLRAMLEETE